MNRRDVLGLGGLCVLAAAATPRVSYAGLAVGHGCYVSGRNETRCQVGFAQSPEIEAQACRSLCWANAVAYVLRGYGVQLSVDRVIDRVEATLSCRARDDAALVMAMSGHWNDDLGRRFLVKAQRFPEVRQASYDTAGFQPLVDGLSRMPLIVGTPGHSMVLTQMSYTDQPFVMMRPEVLTVRDAWNGTPNLRNLDRDDAPESLFAIGLTVRAV